MSTSTVFTGTALHQWRSPSENCWQLVLRIIMGKWDIVSGETSCCWIFLMTFFNAGRITNRLPSSSFELGWKCKSQGQIWEKMNPNYPHGLYHQSLWPSLGYRLFLVFLRHIRQTQRCMFSFSLLALYISFLCCFPIALYCFSVLGLSRTAHLPAAACK